MIRNSVRGLDKLFESETPEGSVILVTGAEGTLKSSLALSAISNYLANNDEHGLYATLEEGEESLLRNMKNIGIEKKARLHIFDYKDVRREWDDQELDIAGITENMIDYYKKKYDNLTIFALDSLNALYSLSSQTNIRKEIYEFFMMLKDKELTSFLIMEKDNSEGILPSCDPMGRPERFLADGIIEVGIVESRENIKRYVQIRKMRATKHKMEKHQLTIGEDGLAVLGSVY